MRISDWSSDVCSSDLVGAPGSGVERVADILAGALPAFRGDRFTHGRAPEDLLQGFNLPSQLASGELDPAAVAADWREQLPARGVANGEVIDWLLWWDNALLPMLRTQRSEEHTSELQSLMRHSYAVFCLK